jgi:hypothetical protein
MWALQARVRVEGQCKRPSAIVIVIRRTVGEPGDSDAGGIGGEGRVREARSGGVGDAHIQPAAHKLRVDLLLQVEQEHVSVLGHETLALWTASSEPTQSRTHTRHDTRRHTTHRITRHHSESREGRARRTEAREDWFVANTKRQTRLRVALTSSCDGSESRRRSSAPITSRHTSHHAVVAPSTSAPLLAQATDVLAASPKRTPHQNVRERLRGGPREHEAQEHDQQPDARRQLHHRFALVGPRQACCVWCERTEEELSNPKL